MIRISNLGFAREGRPILQGIEANIPHGGITALIGPNGAGKSTLLHCLAGLIAPQTGAVTVDDADIHALKPHERARRIALLNQSPPALPRLSVRDLVAFGRWPHHRGRPGPEDDRIVAQSLQAFDLEGLQDRRIDTLSGGQRQRAYVAMTHAQSTPWMLLDEPLAALDPRYARDLMERLHELSRPGPQMRSVILVLHDLGIAARYADWVVTLKGGALFDCAPRARAMSSAGLTSLFETSIRVAEIEGKPVVLYD